MENTVSDFIVGTCQLHRKAYGDIFGTKQFPGVTSPVGPINRLHCGSSAEFYIEPINTCIDDTDFMSSDAGVLVFTDNIPILPNDVRGFLDSVACFKTLSYPYYPGFVKLQRLGNMNYNWRSKEYVFQRNDSVSSFLTEDCYDYSPDNPQVFRKFSLVGPALKCTFLDDTICDIVYCIWCPQWPKEASQWPYRNRRYGWPTTANIRDVVQNGCHVVKAKHPTCRNDTQQWRLSFSVAELILLHSWTPTQQIVYHMLRFFAKRELMKKDCVKEDEVLCTYHFKTLMLWSCEEISQEWWSSLSAIEICCNLLRKLSDWLQKRYCPHFFIPHANLFHERLNQKRVDKSVIRLKVYFHTHILSGWFAMNYIIPILAKVFPFEESNHEDVESCVLRICEIRDAVKVRNFDWQFSCVFSISTEHTATLHTPMIETNYAAFRSNLILAFYMKNHSWKTGCSFLSTIEFSSMLLQFGKVIFVLRIVSALELHNVNCDSEIFAEIIKEMSWMPRAIRSKHHNFPRPTKTNLDRSGVLFLKAQDCMENLNGLNGPQEFKLVSQLSTELLRNALHCQDSNTSAIRNAVLVYMAALHYIDCEYKIAIDLCVTVLHNEPPVSGEKEKKEKETLNAGCLFYIDDVVRIIGCYLLLMRILDNVQYDGKRYLLDLRLTPEVFANYLIISSNEESHESVRRSNNFQTSVFWLDKVLMILASRKCFVISKSKKPTCMSRFYQRTGAIKYRELLLNNISFIHLFVEYSLETMKAVYNVIYKQLDIRCNPVDCYRAAFLYKCCEYPKVMRLCERILNQSDLDRDLNTFTFANVTVIPPFDSYFDTDVQRLLGFHTLVSHLTPSTEDQPETGVKETQPFGHVHLSSVLVSNNYSLRYHYFLRRHFLARYLKVRCMIDTNHPHSEFLFEFKKLKSSLPFEHIIHLFLEQTIMSFQRHDDA